ncbi:unnamed protein product [Rotaria sordida]|uniref:Uncharacterized protein n=1 Tax=Rotaria sordida TaxID=392033 RepID=A0A815CR27_9BILA|nr:unnamed protein product [Rotaria sordida]CAF1286980.1 unnamed protein product [Rotaria sordida]CAF1501366.1 unnamed protein product [Rotaria sordida]
MSQSLLLFIFNICFLLIFIDRTVSIRDSPIIQLSVYPSYGFLPENVEIRCQIIDPSVYDNIYLSVKTDYIKPSGIILMVDNTINRCRTNKEEYINVNICNSSLIHIYINHTILNDTLEKIDYECSQGGVNAISSYQILKDPTARYYDLNFKNSSSILIHTLFLLLFALLFARITTIEELR